MVDSKPQSSSSWNISSNRRFSLEVSSYGTVQIFLQLLIISSGFFGPCKISESWSKKDKKNIVVKSLIAVTLVL